MSDPSWQVPAKRGRVDAAMRRLDLKSSQQPVQFPGTSKALPVVLAGQPGSKAARSAVLE